MVSRRQRDIEQQAEELLRQIGDGTQPIDPIELANANGLRVFNATFADEGIHGLIARRKAGTTIYVNANDKPVRKRFTVAHELGHFILHLATQEGEFIDTEDNFRTLADPDQPWDEARIKEWEANVFAAALLMPRQLMEAKWPEIRDVDGMANWFQVSRQAMAIRLQQLGLGE